MIDISVIEIPTQIVWHCWQVLSRLDWRLKTQKRQASNCIKSFQLFCQTDHQTIHKSRKPSGPERPLGARPEIKTPQNWTMDQGELSARAKQKETKMTSTRVVDWTTLRARGPQLEQGTVDANFGIWNCKFQLRTKSWQLLNWNCVGNRCL